MNIKLNNEMIAALSAQLPKLEKRERDLWEETNKIETEMAPLKTRLNAAASAWSEAYRDLVTIRALCQTTTEQSA